MYLLSYTKNQSTGSLYWLSKIQYPNPTDTPIAVCGHSFGSCVISWLFYHGSSQLQKQIQLCVLQDPVTILLSDPNVMNNFLYSHKVLCCIRMFASSELFTEYYLRHHFSWYNSELWLDEILPGSLSKHDDGKIRHVIVGLSECDEIVDAPKVKRHIDLFLQRQELNESSNQKQRHNHYGPCSGNRQVMPIVYRVAAIGATYNAPCVNANIQSRSSSDNIVASDSWPTAINGIR